MKLRQCVGILDPAIVGIRARSMELATIRPVGASCKNLVASLILGPERMALVGFVDEISRDLVTGWAIDTDHPDRSIDVAITVNGRPPTLRSANRPRPGVGERMKPRIKPELHGAITGLYAFEFSFDPPLSVFREHDVTVRFAETGDPLPRGAKKLSVPKSATTSILPLLVTASGRSGTTVLMQHLARHPGIVVADRYPFEIKLISYYTRAYQVLVSGADRSRSSTPTTIEADPYFIGFNPFNRPGFYSIAKNRGVLEQFFEGTVPQTLASTFSKLLLDYYASLKADQGKTGAMFFAEKASPYETVRQGARLFCGDARELLLIRDPRDVVCSAKAFWQAGHEHSPGEIAKVMRRLQAIYDEDSDTTMLVRYEDLIARTVETLAAIHRFLALDAQHDPTKLPQDHALFARHGTSLTPAASIGRWKTDLTREEIAICERQFAGFLERFGYT
jgi:hypothetical protein